MDTAEWEKIEGLFNALPTNAANLDESTPTFTPIPASIPVTNTVNTRSSGVPHPSAAVADMRCLLDLPREMLAHITLFLDLAGNRAYRLVSRETYNATKGMFSRRYHHTYSCYVNKCGLDHMIAFTSTKDINGTYVPRDAVTTLRLHPGYFKEQ
ncbi:hypothetical protein EJ08DRAFT_699980 [Tothia fuscella]|uniref:F-box domain-containing protein n=1 Tax=Tothia fuscella TaxID=1048955 RepID=A0A9P4NLW6_9PEZI|nr:hypothetical protein EJ08DRAFT_699980 [Tothia fuscella]